MEIRRKTMVNLFDAFVGQLGHWEGVLLAIVLAYAVFLLAVGFIKQECGFLKKFLPKKK
jgi:hypothetical protein